MKHILNAVLLMLIAATAVTAQKEGNVTIRSNVPVKVWIVNARPGLFVNLDRATPVNETLPVGDYAVRIELPDGATSERTITVRRNCTTRLDVTYKPPACPLCPPAPAPLPPPVIPEPPKPDPVTVPHVGPVRFDQCCGCKRDDLKARLDLFAIELHRNPTARGLIVAKTEDAILYLVNQRKVDRARLELRTEDSNCVELWILP